MCSSNYGHVLATYWHYASLALIIDTCNVHVPIMATFLIFLSYLLNNKSFPFHFLMVIEEGLSVTLGTIFIMI